MQIDPPQIIYYHGRKGEVPSLPALEKNIYYSKVIYSWLKSIGPLFEIWFCKKSGVFLSVLSLFTPLLVLEFGFGGNTDGRFTNSSHYIGVILSDRFAIYS